jgi:isopentenyldiphosphate isomerase
MREKVHDGSEICAVSVVNTIDTANISPNRNEISEIRSVDLPSFMDDLRQDKKVYPMGALGKRAHDRTAALVLHDRYSAPF